MGIISLGMPGAGSTVVPRPVLCGSQAELGSHPWFQGMCVMWSLARLQDVLAVWQGPVVAPGNLSSSASGLPVSWKDGNGGVSVAVPLVLGVCCSFSQQSEKGRFYFHVGVTF